MRPIDASADMHYVAYATRCIGGDKTGDDQFYERMVAIADDLYDEHLETLLREEERDKGGRKGG
jgi:hypothetical protein